LPLRCASFFLNESASMPRLQRAIGGLRGTICFDNINGNINTTYFPNTTWDSVPVTTSNPGWQRKIALHLDASTNYAVTRVTSHIPNVLFTQMDDFKTYYPTHWQVSTYSYLQSGVGIFGQYGNDPSAIDISDIDSQALISFHDKLVSMDESVQLLPPLAEAGEIKDMVHSMSQLAQNFIESTRVLNQVRKGNIPPKALKREAKALRESWADAWLTYSFGMSPLCNDLSKATQAVASHIQRVSSRMQRVTASAYKTLPLSAFAGTTSHNGGTWSTTQMGDVGIRVRYTGGYLMHPVQSGYDSLKHYGLDIKSLPLAAWNSSHIPGLEIISPISGMC